MVQVMSMVNWHGLITIVEGQALDVLGRIWHWSIYSAGHIFYFWAWPFIIMPALLMRKHLHGTVTALVWLGVTISLPASGMPERFTGITSYSTALGILGLLCIWTWLEFLSLWFKPRAYRTQSWLVLNKGWLLFFFAIAAAMYEVKKEREKAPKFSL